MFKTTLAALAATLAASAVFAQPATVTWTPSDGGYLIEAAYTNPHTKAHTSIMCRVYATYEDEEGTPYATSTAYCFGVQPLSVVKDCWISLDIFGLDDPVCQPIDGQSELVANLLHIQLSVPNDGLPHSASCFLAGGE